MTPRPSLPLLLLAGLSLLGCSNPQAKAREALRDGKAKLAAHDLDGAATRFAEAGALDPELHEAFARLARVRLEQARGGEAVQAAVVAASLRPGSEYYSELLGFSQLEAGQKDAALASFQQAITLDAAQTARLGFVVGHLLEGDERAPEALTWYERAAAASPEAVLPRLALGRLYLDAHRNDDAQRVLAEARAHVGAEGARLAELDARLAAVREAERLAAEEQARAAREAALAQAQTMGILGVLGGSGGLDGSVFGRMDTLGSDPALGGLMGDTIGESFGFGGLGLRGVGVGGGGTGEGTIGLGNVGVIGRGGGGGIGQGYGSGAGGFGRPTGPTPRVTLSMPTVSGQLAPEIVQRIVRRHVNELRFCYEQALAANPALTGGGTATFVIGPQGEVQGAQFAGMSDASVTSCVEGRLRTWSFPTPEGGGVVRVTQTVTFSTATAN